MANRLKILSAPSPFHRLNSRRLITILGIGAFVAVFLLVFQPFGTDRVTFPYKNWFLAGYGAVVSATFLLIEWIFQRSIFKHQNEERWTVVKQILWIVFLSSISLAACYAYKQWFFNQPFTISGFWYLYKIGITVAIFPITIVTLIEYIFYLKRNQTIALQVNDDIKQSPTVSDVNESTNMLQLIAENKKQTFKIPAQDLYYIQSADNYVEIVYQKDQVKKEILRNTLAKLEQQIALDYILRCHRSFIINLSHVDEVSGNAQGYKLHLKTGDIVIPVARSKSKLILNKLKEMRSA